MRFGFVVSDLGVERSVYTTVTVALAALRRGHEVCWIDVDAFAWEPDGRIEVAARSAALPLVDAPDAAAAAYLRHAQQVPATPQAIERLDLLWLRSEPSFDAVRGARVPSSTAFAFGRAAAQAGLTVLSDPDALAWAAADKLYTQTFAPHLRPKTLVTCDPEAVRAFAAQHDGDIVIKPLQGGGGLSVFFVGRGDRRNLRQITEAVAQLGYVVVQEDLPEARAGVTRLFMLDGEPLRADGAVAALLHVPAGGDPRSNYRVSERIAPATLDDGVLAVAATVGPQLRRDGMFFVGLDIVGGRLLEANLFSPGGLRGAELLHGARFCDAVVDAMEERVRRRTASPAAA